MSNYGSTGSWTNTSYRPYESVKPRNNPAILKVGDEVRMVLVENGGGNPEFANNIARIIKKNNDSSFEIEVIKGPRLGIKTNWNINGTTWDFELVNCDWDQ